MQSAKFELSVEELDQRFVEALKALFTGQKIRITVSSGVQDSVPILKLSEIIASNKRSSTIHQFSGETLDFLIDKMTEEEGFDLVGELEQYRAARP